MAVTAVEKIWEGSGNFAVSDEGSATGSIIEVYNVFVNDPENDDALVVASAPGLPLVNQQYPTSFYYRAKKLDPRRVSPIQWVVTVTYESLSGTSLDPNPLNKPAVVRWATIKETGEIDEDIHGNALVTANGEPVRGVKRPFSNIAAIITKNIATFNPHAFDGYIDRVDNSGFLGSTPGTAMLDDVSAEPVDDGDFQYEKLTSKVIIRKPIRTTPARAWWYRTLHQGYIIRTPGGDLIRAKDDNGEFASSMVRLTATGEKEPTDNGANYLEFEILESVNLTTSGII